MDLTNKNPTDPQSKQPNGDGAQAISIEELQKKAAEAQASAIFDPLLAAQIESALVMANKIAESEEGKKFLAMFRSVGLTEQLRGLVFIVKHLGEEICEQLRLQNKLRLIAIMIQQCNLAQIPLVVMDRKKFIEAYNVAQEIAEEAFCKKQEGGEKIGG